MKLLDEGVIPHAKTDCRRRVTFADLMAYKELREHAGRETMDQLAAQAQELGMG
ncbi:hypothetical protein D9M68_726640 [compost metagenome]